MPESAQRGDLWSRGPQRPCHARIVPVRLAVHRGRISARIQGHADIGDGLDDAIVAFQADGYDDDTQQVWSVHVVGRVTARCESGFAINPSVIEGEWLPL